MFYSVGFFILMFGTVLPCNPIPYLEYSSRGIAAEARANIDPR